MSASPLQLRYSACRRARPTCQVHSLHHQVFQILSCAVRVSLGSARSYPSALYERITPCTRCHLQTMILILSPLSQPPLLYCSYHPLQPKLPMSRNQPGSYLRLRVLGEPPNFHFSTTISLHHHHPLPHLLWLSSHLPWLSSHLPWLSS